VNIVQEAENELAEWALNGGDETSAWGQAKVASYWREIGQAPPPVGTPWSGAFVSALANRANPGSLAKTGAHIYYARDALRRRLQSDAGYHAFAPDVAPPVHEGDIVIRSRGNLATDWNSIVGGSDFRETHGDIVISAAGTKARVVGGNVSNRVQAREIMLDAQGHLAGVGWVALLTLAPGSGSGSRPAPGGGKAPTREVLVRAGSR